MGKTRDLCKNIREIKGTFHTKMGLIKERNGRDLTEAEDNKKKWLIQLIKINEKNFKNNNKILM